MKTFSRGKLLLTAEYAVLDGALALAVPTKLGQSLKAENIDEPKLNWTNFDEKGTVWYEATFDVIDNKIVCQNDNDSGITKRLLQILQATKKLNPSFLNTGYTVENKLSFPKDWGLGTSSTLINNMASWAEVDAYTLLDLTFGGSGYDIACAQNDAAITYQLIKNQHIERQITKVDFNPIFKDCLYFVYLNKKQNSRDGIAHYKSHALRIPNAVLEINKLTSEIIRCNTLSDFESLILQHEAIISNLTKQVPVKDKLFSDFDGQIKSLGAWGGDFVLVTAKENPSAYFKAKGFETLIPYRDLII